MGLEEDYQECNKVYKECSKKVKECKINETPSTGGPSFSPSDAHHLAKSNDVRRRT